MIATGTEPTRTLLVGHIDTVEIGKVPCATIGAGNPALAHQPNEYVEAASLEATKQLVEKIIKRRL